jgi:gliding motility-associated-like protein
VKDFNNIEELFKDKLNGFEADPGAGVWESVSQSLASGKAATGSAAAGTVAKFSALKWVAGVVLISGGIGLTTMYLNNSENEKTVQNKETANQNKEVQKELAENKEQVTVVANEEATQHQTDVIVKDEKKNKTIIVSVKENPKFNMNKSSVDNWITKRTNYTVNSSSSNTNDAVAVISSDTKTEMPATFEVKVVDETKPIAAITRSISGGPAPLTVTFSNATDVKSCEWTIGGSVITEDSYTHVFETPGTYKVKLTVKDAKGNKANDEVEITVGEPVKTEVADKSKLEAKGVNVFTPNNDGVNDSFYIQFEYENLESFLLQVTNLNGEVIFETTEPDFKWDGTMRNGEIIPVGMYLYHYMAIGKDKMKYSDSKSFKVSK